MNYSKKTVRDMDVAGKKVLLRCDFNVPQDKVTGEITSDKRIVAALPTIRYLLEQGAAVIACSHLGKPKDGPDPKLSLAPVAKRLSELLGRKPPPCAPARFCCWKTPGLKRARPKMIPRLPRPWLPWQTSSCLTPSVQSTVPTPPLPAWLITCLPCPAS